MAQVFKASIDLAKVQKKNIFITEDGRKYLSIKLIFNKEQPDEYGGIGFIAQSMPKEDAEALPNKGIIGNIKVTAQSQPNNEEIDDMFN